MAISVYDAHPRDTWAMAARVCSSIFVGRSAELAELEAALADAATGRPWLAFIAGDSGVGKTRLLSEFTARARASGARALSGDCVELGEGELPYAPLVTALRSLARARDPVLDQLPASVRIELATLIPGLGDGAAGAAGSGDGSAQARLFEALLWLLDRLGQDAPVMLAIEDLHWADRATRAFVAFLGRSLCRERVLVVATYRSDELHRRHPLRPLLAELERDVGSRRIALPPLTREELAEQLADLLGETPDEELVKRVFARSEGHPLFVEELIAAGRDGRGSLPSTLRDALMLRIERLSAAAQEVLRVIAVGQRLDDELLTSSTGLERAALQEALREAVANHILVVTTEGRYHFRHALLREVVHDDLLPGERAAIDLRLARAFEAHAERDGTSVYVAAAIAHHYASAGDSPAALRASVHAADAAEGVHAYGQAAALLERVVALSDRVPDAEMLAGAGRAEILRRAADDHGLEGDAQRQESLARAGLALVDERAEPQQAARLLETLREAQWHLGLGEESLATIEHAFSLLPPGEMSPERGALLGSQAKTLMLRGKHVRAVEVARETLTAADVLDSVSLRGRGLNALGTSLMALGDVEQGASALREAVALAKKFGFPWQENSAYVNLADALHLAGRLRDARAVVDEGLSYELRPNRVWLLILRGELAIEAGEWDEAEAILGAIGERQIGNTLVNLDLRRAELALGRGEHASARRLLEEAADVGAAMDEPQFTGVLGALSAELERREGDLAAAHEALQSALDRIETRTDDAARLARVSAAGTTVEADAAQRARDLGEADAESLALAAADRHLTRAEAAAANDGPLEVAWLLNSRAERTRASGIADPAAYAAAGEAWTGLERPYPAAVARFRQAEAYANAGDRAAASASARDGHATAVRIGAGWLRDEIEGLAARSRLQLALAVASVEPEADGDTTEDPFGLTPRERQVLELIARGATNREIGAELFMAEKTASVHVSRILMKLDVRSRTEAAGVAHRLGLTE
jgi:DNA-binding CsgD family transcriptional regulator/tetratricopeptide (TPR) repeat protein